MNWITKKISELKSSSLAKKILKKMPTFSFQEKELNPWTSCCDGPILKSDLFSKTNLGVCPKCDRHHIINAKQKLNICFKGESNYRILDISRILLREALFPSGSEENFMSFFFFFFVLR